MELSQPPIASSTPKTLLSSSFTTYGATAFGTVMAENGVKIGSNKGAQWKAFTNFNGSFPAPLSEVFSSDSLAISPERLEEVSQELEKSEAGTPPATVTFIRYYLEEDAIEAGCCELVLSNGSTVGQRGYIGEGCPAGWEETASLSCDDYGALYPILECQLPCNKALTPFPLMLVLNNILHQS